MANILVCDDDKEIVDAIEIYLMNEGYQIYKAYDGEQAVQMIKSHDIHLLIMDVMMPRLDGIHATLKIREYSSIPIIILSAKSEDTDKILGLNIGADDYVTKPFNPLEVLARVRSQLRRYTQLGSSASAPTGVYTVGGITLDDRQKAVTLDGEPVALTPTEYDILRLMMRRAGEVLSPAEIYKSVWKDAPFGAESTIAVHIRHLREKIEIDPADPRYLKVVWGKGYRLETDRKG